MKAKSGLIRNRPTPGNRKNRKSYRLPVFLSGFSGLEWAAEKRDIFRKFPVFPVMATPKSALEAIEITRLSVPIAMHGDLTATLVSSLSLYDPTTVGNELSGKVSFPVPHGHPRRSRKPVIRHPSPFDRRRP